MSNTPKTKEPARREALAQALRGFGSFEKAAYALRNRGVDVSASYLSLLVRGVRTASVPTARALAEALHLRYEEVGVFSADSLE